MRKQSAGLHVFIYQDFGGDIKMSEICAGGGVETCMTHKWIHVMHAACVLEARNVWL